MHMCEHDFAKGVGLGMVAGVAMGMAMAPKKRCSMKKTAGKAIKAVGQMMEDLSADMGF